MESVVRNWYTIYADFMVQYLGILIINTIVAELVVLLVHDDEAFTPLILIIGFVTNLINKTLHECEKMEYNVIVL